MKYRSKRRAQPDKTAALLLSVVVLSTESSVCECDRTDVQSECQQSECHIETISSVCYTYAQDKRRKCGQTFRFRTEDVEKQETGRRT